jgi:hypothetical protein
MRCAPVIVLFASNTVSQGIRQLEHFADGRRVVVVREHNGEVRYYVFKASALRTRLVTATAYDLASALYLDEFPAAAAGQLSGPLPPVGGVALEGRQVVGVIVDDTNNGQRSATRGGAPITGLRPTHKAGTNVDRDAGDDLGEVAVSPTATDQAPPAMVAPPGGGLFHAYPEVKAPHHVRIGLPFTVEVGFAEKPSPSMLIKGPPIMVMTGPMPEFILQVSGFGFVFPDGIQRTLLVDREKPDAGFARFTVQADPSEAAAPRILEISYEYAGAVVGRTWAKIQVTHEAPAEPMTGAPAGGSGLIAAACAENTAPHLSVDILSDDGRSELRWLFHTRYSEIARPRNAVTTNLTNDSARCFAVQLMKQIPSLQKGSLLPATMKGIGKRVADVLPREFWILLAEAWQRARSDGEQPRMQITLTEPWIPWELAWIDRDRFAEAADLLPPEAKGGATLGQLWQVARWTTPVRHLTSGDVPASPPAHRIDADQMAVIIGSYPALPGFRSLPHAEEEGTSIAMAYGGMPLTASDSDVTALMGCNLQRAGQAFKPAAIHFAGHGQTDLNSPQLTGLVLADGRRLDPIAVGGFPLVAEQQPFVFLNACEAGVADETLMNLGGMVGAFLLEGARGFVAPLWKVDDGDARDIAIEFYQLTFSAGETVGEAMRQIRLKFNPESASATSLAYVFYGSPDLRLEHGAA